MHPRHRNPGNGYRSNSVGMGFGVSRSSPDSSVKGHGFYNSENSSFNNRGFGRGRGGRYRSYQQPHQPPPLPQKADILMQAGRLAAAYLVSKGLLPSSALSGEWQNGDLKKPVDNFREFTQQEDLLQDARASVHARLGGSSGFEAGSGRRRYSDDFNSRNQTGGRRRGEYYRSYSSEWGREYERSGSWSDRKRASLESEGDDDTASGHQEDQQVDVAVDGIENSGPSMLEKGNEEAASVESGPGKEKLMDEQGPKESSSSTKKDETVDELHKGSEDVENSDLENEKLMNTNDVNETVKQLDPDDLPFEEYEVDDDIPSKRIADLVTLSKFGKVPRKMRSALTSRTSKVGRSLDNEEQSHPDVQISRGSEGLVHVDIPEISTTNVLLENTTCDPIGSDSKKSEDLITPSIEDSRAMSPYGGKGSGAFQHENENESYDALQALERSPIVKERGEKRAADVDDMNEAAKKPRDSASSLVNQSVEQSTLASLSVTSLSTQAGTVSPDQQVIGAVTENSWVSNFHFVDTVGDPCNEYVQEKQLFPSSFKICDLNLMEAADANDNHRRNSALMYPSVMNIDTEGVPDDIDIDLSMSNSNMHVEYGRHSSSGKEIEVIDLENDSTPENEDLKNSHTKEEVVFACTQGIPSHTHSTTEIVDVQDNYDGLIISEFLDTFSNCPSVTAEINPLPNEMDLHNGEGALADDDSIYMSLEEIPLSFIPAWQQPTPKGYEKPF